MTLAHRLAQRGHASRCSRRPDAWAASPSAWTLGDVTWDRHYHVTLLSDTRLRALLGELGLERRCAGSQTRTGFYTDGRLYSMSNTLEFLRFPPLGLVDKLRARRRRSSTPRASRTGRRWSASPSPTGCGAGRARARSRRSGCRCCAPSSARTTAQTSAAFIWATIARMYAARRTGLKKEMFGYVPGRLRAHPRTLRGDARARGRARSADGPRGDAASTAPGEGRVVVESGDGYAARRSTGWSLTVRGAAGGARICPRSDARREGPSRRRSQYQGDRLRLAAAARSRSPATTSRTSPTRGCRSPRSSRCRRSSTAQQFGGHTLVYLPKYVAPDDPAVRRARTRRFERRSFRALRAHVPGLPPRSDVLAFRVSRVRHVFALADLRATPTDACRR